jgi:hypothetical protein
VLGRPLILYIPDPRKIPVSTTDDTDFRDKVMKCRPCGSGSRPS